MNALKWSRHHHLLSGLALAAAGCSDAATSDPIPVDTAVADSDTPVPDSLGPIGAPTRPFCLRVDGGHFTHEQSPMLAPDGVGGFYAAGLVRRDPQRDRDELWTARFDGAGVPLWHSVREGPRIASGVTEP